MADQVKHYQFFQNRACEYFPCHQGIDEADFNCLFCYCPLYALGARCGGDFTYTETGVKDCSACLRPLDPDNYEKILEAFPEVVKLAKE